VSAPGPQAIPWQDLQHIFEEHQRLVLNAAYRVTGSLADAEDVLQTVFLRLLRRPNAIDPERGAAPYLHRAAVNAALDVLRARRAPTVAVGPIDENSFDQTDNQNPPLHEVELRDQLRAALATIPPDAARLFVMRYIEGCSNSEIAETENASRGWVAVTLHRARARLKKEMEK
jgi:RNA polymerase sigma-70 factor (ECF subfamily)